MAITQRGSTTHTTQANSATVVVNKPTGVVSGDVMIALITSNDGNITAATGWVKIGHTDGGNPDLFDATWWYKVAGGSEGSTYTFTNAGGAAPMIGTVIAFTGVDTSSSPIGGSSILGSSNLATEPKSIAGCTNTPTALAIYSRSCRVGTGGGGGGADSSPGHPLTYTATGPTELEDVGIWSGGTVSYSHGIYMGSEAAGNPSSISVTGTGTIQESDNITASLTLITFNPNVSVNAGLATATAAPSDVGIGLTPDAPNATATAQQPTVLAGTVAPAGVATATATANGVGNSVAVHGVETAGATAAGVNGGIYYGAPPGRTSMVGAENRGYKPDAESRNFTVIIQGID